MKIYQTLEVIILVLVCLFFVGMFDSLPGLNLDESIFSIPEEVKTVFELLIYPIIVLLIVDLSLKYRKTKNLKIFVKKYWVDIFMLGMIPIFSILKFLKIGITLTKHLKALKMGTKVIHKSKKIAKK